MPRDEAYMLTLFLCGVAVMAVMALIIVKSATRRPDAQPQAPKAPAASAAIMPAPPPPPPPIPPAPPRPPRVLSPLQCVWAVLSLHLSYTIPAVLIVSLAHGWFLIDFADALHADMTENAISWGGLAGASAFWFMLTVSPTIFMLFGWAWHVEYWDRDNPDAKAQIERAFDPDSKLLPGWIAWPFSALAWLYVIAVPFAVMALAPAFYDFFHD